MYKLGGHAVILGHHEPGQRESDSAHLCHCSCRQKVFRNAKTSGTSSLNNFTALQRAENWRAQILFPCCIAERNAAGDAAINPGKTF
jgi:hypothetical protein